MTRALALIVFLIAAAIQTRAAEFNEIKGLCDSDPELCTLYFGGLGGGLIVFGQYLEYNKLPRQFCPPVTTMEALAHVVMRYIQAHPEQWHFQTGVLGLQAFREAFPCKQ